MKRVEHYPNGNIKRVEVRNKYSECHNDNGPAYQAWHKNGQECHREYHVNGKCHNEDRPAIQRWHENGQEEFRSYWINDKFHNDNGPAYQEWYPNGKEFRRVYYLNGEKLTEEEFYKLKNTVEVQANGKTVRISQQSAKELGLI